MNTKSRRNLIRIIAIVTLMLFILPIIVIAAAPTDTEVSESDVNIVSTRDEINVIKTTTAKIVDSTEAIKECAEENTENYDIIDGNYCSGVSTFDESNMDYYHDLLARAIYCESGGCSEYCQWLVGSAILNLADERGGIENVVFDYNTINVAYILYDYTPSDLSYGIAKKLLDGNRDYQVKYFRTNYYHGFGTPYTNVDNVYFSTK